MNVPIVRKLVTDHDKPKIDEAVTAFEKKRENILAVEGKDPGEILSNLLAAQFVKERMERGLDLNAALREYGYRVKGILSPR